VKKKVSNQSSGSRYDKKTNTNLQTKQPKGDTDLADMPD
jgi:hypothetical protein